MASHARRIATGIGLTTLVGLSTAMGIGQVTTATGANDSVTVAPTDSAAESTRSTDRTGTVEVVTPTTTTPTARTHGSR